MMEETTREHRSLRALLWWTLLFFTLQLVAALVFGVHEDDGLRWPSLLLPGESVKDAVLLSFSEVETKESTISDGEGLKVAWIMSFGGSGTSYTIMNTEKMSRTTTATNYARDIKPCVPVQTNWTSGPFLHEPLTMALPSSYVLTKTHCGGYCIECSPHGYVLSTKQFEEACVTVQSCEDDGRKTTYEKSIPSKAVHLVRDPFSNLVGRMHLHVKLQLSRGEITSLEDTPFTDTVQGFKAWCKYLDDTYAEVEADSTVSVLFRRYADLPCHAEWFRYLQWHNRALEVQERLNLSVYYLYYENYTENFDETVHELFDFLELSIRDETPQEFIAGNSHLDLFEESHLRLAAKFAQDQVSTKTWSLLQHYFAPHLSNDNDNAKKATPEVAWLLSFPNSGTSYTITNTEQMSNATTATNYAIGEYFEDEIVPVRPDLWNGPFLHFSTLNVPAVVLTKTHCTGYCNECGPKGYIVANIEAFEKGCLTAKANLHSGEVATLQYDASVPTRAVHLIRNPFDNAVSRFRFSIRNQEWPVNFTSTKEGFREWCEFMAVTYGDYGLHDEIKELLRGIPCGMEFHRYVQWHNYAVSMTKKMGIPVHYLYYESYTTDFNRTIDKLFEFLEIEQVQEPLPFIPGKTYLSYYDDDEKERVRRLVQSMATPYCWELLRVYFE